MASSTLEGEAKTLSGKETPKNSEEVLIERDGKFELVSAKDMQADRPPTEDNSPEKTSKSASVIALPEPPLTTEPDERDQTESEVQPEPESEVQPEPERPEKNKNTSTENTSNVQPEPLLGTNSNTQDSSPRETEPAVADKDIPSSSASDEKPASGVSGEKPDSDKKNVLLAAESVTDQTSHQDIEDNRPDQLCTVVSKDPTNISMENHPSSAEIEKLESYVSGAKISSIASCGWERPKSESFKQQWGEREMDKKQRNELAFKAWLEKKDTQVAEQRKVERVNAKVSTKEEQQQRMQQCRLAYKAWLENKTKEIRERRLQEHAAKSASQGTPNDSKVQSTLSFQQWMEQKDHQRQKEQELEIRRIKETEEIAVKVDPSLAERAYNQWLYQKNVEARQEAARRRELLRMYFKQGKRLKQSLRARFQGF